MTKFIAKPLHLLLEIFYYFGTSFVIIVHQITRIIRTLLNVITNLFWLMLYGTPALLIISLTSLIFAFKFFKKILSSGVSLTTIQRNFSFTSK